MFRQIFLIIPISLLVSCASHTAVQNSSTYTPVVKATQTPEKGTVKTVTIKDDEFDKNIIFEGISEYYDIDRSEYYDVNERDILNRMNNFLIRSWLNKDTGEVEHQLYFSSFYRSTGWHNWYSAHDQNASSLNVVKIDHNVNCHGGCVYFETVGITMPNKLMEENRNTGFKLKISGKSGDEKIISVTPLQIALQLDAIATKAPVKKVSEAVQERPKSSSVKAKNKK